MTISATILPPPETTFFYDDGRPLALGKVYTYIPNTSTPKNTWQDAGKNTLNTNPITLDAAGRGLIYGDGAYRFLIKDSDGNTIYDQLTNFTGLPLSGVVAGSYTNANITVSETGLITAASNGTNSGVTGQCRLSYTSSVLLTLNPYNGANLIINSIAQIVPSSVTLSSSGLSAGTLYYIYAYMVSTTMTLEASATAPATQAGTGIKIKTGDATRSLVGMVYTDGSGNFQDAAINRCVRSWFNEAGLSGSNFLLANSDAITSVSPSYTELTYSSGTTARAGVALWQNERVFVTMNAQCSNGTLGGLHSFIGVNLNTSVSTPVSGIMNVYTAASNQPSNGTHSIDFGANGASINGGGAVNEGFNYMTMFAAVDSGSGTWIGVKAETNLSYITVRRQ